MSSDEETPQSHDALLAAKELATRTDSDGDSEAISMTPQGANGEPPQQHDLNILDAVSIFSRIC